jgi:hypothetical protein
VAWCNLLLSATRNKENSSPALIPLDATCPRRQPLSPGPSNHTARRVKALPTPLGSSRLPTTISSAISPSLLGKSAFALSRTLCALFVQFKTPNPDPRWSMVNDSILSGISLSGNRHMKGQRFTHLSKPRMPRCDATCCHLLHYSCGTRRNSGSRNHSFSTVLSTLKTPKCRVPTPRDLVPPVPALIDGSD